MTRDARSEPLPSRTVTALSGVPRMGTPPVPSVSDRDEARASEVVTDLVGRRGNDRRPSSSVTCYCGARIVKGKLGFLPYVHAERPIGNPHYARPSGLRRVASTPLGADRAATPSAVRARPAPSPVVDPPGRRDGRRRPGTFSGEDMDTTDVTYRIAVEQRIAELWRYRSWWRSHRWAEYPLKRMETDIELRALVRLARLARKAARSADEHKEREARRLAEAWAEDLRREDEEWTNREGMPEFNGAFR